MGRKGEIAIVLSGIGIVTVAPLICLILVVFFV